MVKLGEVFKITSGGTPEKKKIEYYQDGTIPWVKTGDLKELYVTDKVECITELGLKNSSAKLFPKGTVLIAMYGATIGACSILSFEATTNQACAAFLPNDEFLPEYLYYFLSSKKESFIKDGVGGAQPNISAGYLKNVEILKVAVEKQRAVIGSLSRIENVITRRKKQLQKLDELVKARFVEMFGSNGNQVPLMDYVWFQEGPGVRTVDFTETGTILLTGSNINDNKITFGHKSDRHISNELAMGKYAHFMCDKDDVLVVSSAIDPIKFDKKVVVVDEDKKYCLNTGIIRFKPNKRYLTLGYFREFLKTDYFKNQVSSEMRGIAQMHFGPSHLKQMTILLPDSINLQIEFEEFVQQIDKSKLSVQKSLEKLETLKKALVQKYFG